MTIHSGKRLSPKMVEALDVARANGGELVSLRSGWWTWPFCPRDNNQPLYQVPSWHTSTNTIKALVARGLMEPIQSRGYYNRVRIKP